MTFVAMDLPEEVNEKLKIYQAINKISRKQDAIVLALNEVFKINNIHSNKKIKGG
jgi:hypothetical protein